MLSRPLLFYGLGRTENKPPVRAVYQFVSTLTHTSYIPALPCRNSRNTVSPQEGFGFFRFFIDLGFAAALRDATLLPPPEYHSAESWLDKPGRCGFRGFLSSLPIPETAILSTVHRREGASCVRADSMGAPSPAPAPVSRYGNPLAHRPRRSFFSTTSVTTKIVSNPQGGALRCGRPVLPSGAQLAAPTPEPAAQNAYDLFAAGSLFRNRLPYTARSCRILLMAPKLLPYLTAAERLRCVLNDSEGLTGRQYTVEELSLLLDVEPGLLRRILRGHAPITLTLAFSIAKLSRRYSVMWLIGGSLYMYQRRPRYAPFAGEWELARIECLTAPGQWTKVQHIA